MEQKIVRIEDDYSDLQRSFSEHRHEAENDRSVLSNEENLRKKYLISSDEEMEPQIKQLQRERQEQYHKKKYIQKGLSDSCEHLI
jgi:hypothetical protein